MITYPNLISDICGSKKTTINVSKAIPILVRWAKNGIVTNTYGDLIHELGYERFSGIGYVLGCIEDVFKELRKLLLLDIPTLNALVKGKNNLPSSGFEYVFPEYSSYPDSVKKALAENENQKAISYKDWDIILQLLGLEPSVVNSKKDEDLIRSGAFGYSGEGEKHNALKMYIFSHPESIGLKNISERKTEYILLSGDRLDVYFEQKSGTKIAVEVKSSVSSDDDILRGLYQCVKYKAVLEAEAKTHGILCQVQNILVIEGKLSESNQQVKDSLGLFVVEGFRRLPKK